MKSKEEKQEWILENCVDRLGIIRLNNLEFPRVVDLSGLKADLIFNSSQKAGAIYNDNQRIIETKSLLQKKIEELELKSQELQSKISELKKQAENENTKA